MIEAFTHENDFAAFIAARNCGECCLIDEEMYLYFLEVLPPRFMGRIVELVDGHEVRADFGFAEGAERITAFWRRGKDDGTDLHFAQHTKLISRGD